MCCVWLWVHSGRKNCCAVCSVFRGVIIFILLHDDVHLPSSLSQNRLKGQGPVQTFGIGEMMNDSQSQSTSFAFKRIIYLFVVAEQWKIIQIIIINSVPGERFVGQVHHEFHQYLTHSMIREFSVLLWDTTNNQHQKLSCSKWLWKGAAGLIKFNKKKVVLHFMMMLSHCFLRVFLELSFLEMVWWGWES